MGSSPIERCGGIEDARFSPCLKLSLRRTRFVQLDQHHQSAVELLLVAALDPLNHLVVQQCRLRQMAILVDPVAVHPVDPVEYPVDPVEYPVDPVELRLDLPCLEILAILPIVLELVDCLESRTCDRIDHHFDDSME